MPLLRRVLPVSLRELSDTQLLRRVLRQDEQAWTEFMRRFRPLIFRCISKVVGRYDAVLSSADPDEIFGEVLLAVVRDDFRKLRLWDSRRGTKLSSWLGMIATNTAYDYLRRKRRIAFAPL